MPCLHVTKFECQNCSCVLCTQSFDCLFQICPLRLHSLGVRYINCNFAPIDSTRCQFTPRELFNFVIQFKCSALKSKFHLLFSQQFSLLFWAHISLSGLSEFSDTLRLPLNCIASAPAAALPFFWPSLAR